MARFGRSFPVPYHPTTVHPQISADVTVALVGVSAATSVGTTALISVPILTGTVASASIGTGIDLTVGLTSFWDLDETSGTRADAFGTNNLTDNNTVLSATGLIGNAADFTAANSEYLSIADNASLSSGDTDFSIQFWVKAKSLPVNPAFTVIASKGWYHSVTGNHEWVVFIDSAASNHITFGVSSGGVDTYARSSVTCVVDTWYCIHVWHDSVNNVIGIAINDGTPVTAAQTAGVNDGASPFILGASLDQLYYWDGQIDLAAFWRKVLAATDRTALYNSGSGVASGSMVGGALLPAVSISVTNTLATIAVGTVTPATADVTLALTGVSATTTLNAITFSHSQVISGLAATSAVGVDIPSETLAASGVSATTTLNAITFNHTQTVSGQVATGAVGIDTPSETLAATGVPATITAGVAAPIITTGAAGNASTGAAGIPVALSSSNVALTGTTSTSAVGAIAPKTSVTATSFVATAAVGTETPGTLTGVVGVGATDSVGTVSAGQAGTATLSGVSATTTAGSFGITRTLGISGPLATTSLGTVAPLHTSALVGVTSTSAVGSVSLGASTDVTHALTGVASTTTLGSISVKSTVVSLGVQATTPAASYHQQVLADGATHQWRLDDTPGPYAVDGLTEDITYRMVVQAFPSHVFFSQAPIITDGTAARFDGQDWLAVNGRIVPDAISAFTLELWFKPSTVSLTGGDIAILGTSNGNRVFINSDGLSVTLKLGGGTNTFSTGVMPVAGNTYYAVVTYDGATLTMYINGVAYSAPGSGTLDFGQRLIVGSTELGGWANFIGNIDEVAVYTSVLSASRVSAHYAAGIATIYGALGATHTSSSTGVIATTSTGLLKVVSLASGVQAAGLVGVLSPKLQAAILGNGATTTTGTVFTGSATLAAMLIGTFELTAAMSTADYNRQAETMTGDYDVTSDVMAGTY